MFQVKFFLISQILEDIIDIVKPIVILMVHIWT